MNVAPNDMFPGTTFAPLPDGCVTLGAIVLVKALNDEGLPMWLHRYSIGGDGETNLSRTEVVGALAVAHGIELRDLIDCYSALDDDDAS